MTLRDLAARIGISHFALHSFLSGKSVRPKTLGRIESWVKKPGEDEAVHQLRGLLKRVVGKLGAAEARELEGAIGEAIGKAFERAGESAPKWLAGFGKKQR